MDYYVPTGINYHNLARLLKIPGLKNGYRKSTNLAHRRFLDHYHALLTWEHADPLHDVNHKAVTRRLYPVPKQRGLQKSNSIIKPNQNAEPANFTKRPLTAMPAMCEKLMELLSILPYDRTEEERDLILTLLRKMPAMIRFLTKQLGRPRLTTLGCIEKVDLVNPCADFSRWLPQVATWLCIEYVDLKGMRVPLDTGLNLVLHGNFHCKEDGAYTYIQRASLNSLHWGYNAQGKDVYGFNSISQGATFGIIQEPSHSPSPALSQSQEESTPRNSSSHRQSITWTSTLAEKDENFKLGDVLELRRASLESLRHRSGSTSLESPLTVTHVKKGLQSEHNGCILARLSTECYFKILNQLKAEDTLERMSILMSQQHFKNWPRQALALIAKEIQWARIAPGLVCMQEGDVAPYVGYIQKGRVLVSRTLDVKIPKREARIHLPKYLNKDSTRNNEDKKLYKILHKKVVVETLGPGQSFGEYSFTNSVAMNCTVEVDVEAGPLSIAMIQFHHNMEMALNEPLANFKRHFNADLNDTKFAHIDEDTFRLWQQSCRPMLHNVNKNDIAQEYLEQQKEKTWQRFKRQLFTELKNK